MRVAGMDPRFVTKTMHAYLDYPVAASLVALPFMLGLGTSASYGKMARRHHGRGGICPDVFHGS
jgi:hypothetical protein